MGDADRRAGVVRWVGKAHSDTTAARALAALALRVHLHAAPAELPLAPPRGLIASALTYTWFIRG